MEREVIVSRFTEGMEKVKRYGMKSDFSIGRPAATLAKDFEKYYKKSKSGEKTGVEFSRLLKIARTILYRYFKVYER
jgi:hypothetical protein